MSLVFVGAAAEFAAECALGGQGSFADLRPDTCILRPIIGSKNIKSCKE